MRDFGGKSRKVQIHRKFTVMNMTHSKRTEELYVRGIRMVPPKYTRVLSTDPI